RKSLRKTCVSLNVIGALQAASVLSTPAGKRRIVRSAVSLEIAKRQPWVARNRRFSVATNKSIAKSIAFLVVMRHHRRSLGRAWFWFSSCGETSELGLYCSLNPRLHLLVQSSVMPVAVSPAAGVVVFTA